MSRLAKTIALIVFGALSIWTSTASAQTKVLLLLTETTMVDGEPSDSFWWHNTSEVAWTASDAFVLQNEDLQVVRPSDVSRISKIYRRPGLSDANAAALAELFGADTALVGSIERMKLDPRPLGSDLYRVVIRARLVEPTPEGARIRSSFALDRVARGEGEGALESATREAASTLAQLTSTALQRKVGPVGISQKERTIALHGLPTLEHWRTIREALVARPDVDEVEVVWMAEGVLALTINPGADDSDETVDRVATGLLNTPFETFQLTTHEGVSGTNALRVAAKSAP